MNQKTKLRELAEASRRNKLFDDTLVIAERRIEEGKYTNPENDSAQYHIYQLGKLIPKDTRVTKLVDTLISKKLSQINSAIDAQKFDDALRAVEDCDELLLYRTNILGVTTEAVPDETFTDLFARVLSSERSRSILVAQQRNRFLERLTDFYMNTCKMAHSGSDNIWASEQCDLIRPIQLEGT